MKPAESDEAGGISPSVRSTAEALADVGDVLTERQALAYLLRDVEGVPRQRSAELMGVSVSTLDTTLGRARSNVSDAAELIMMLNGLEEPPALARQFGDE